MCRLFTEYIADKFNNLVWKEVVDDTDNKEQEDKFEKFAYIRPLFRFLKFLDWS